MINKVILIGNLGKDAETRQLENGNSVTNFPLATSESYKDKTGEWQTNTEWHSIVIWKSNTAKKLSKGDKVYVEGKLTTRKWQDKDGNDRYTTEVSARILRSLEKKESNANDFPTANDEPRNLNDDFDF